MSIKNLINTTWNDFVFVLVASCLAVFHLPARDNMSLKSATPKKRLVSRLVTGARETDCWLDWSLSRFGWRWRARWMNELRRSLSCMWTLQNQGSASSVACSQLCLLCFWLTTVCLEKVRYGGCGLSIQIKTNQFEPFTSESRGFKREVKCVNV